MVAIVAVMVFAAWAIGYLGYCNGDSLDFSDTQVKVVISGSMDGEPRTDCDIETIPVKSMVFISEVPSDEGSRNAFYDSLEVGDVLTFDYIHPVSHESMTVTHRIVGITEADGVYTYMMQGDAIADDPLNHSVQIVTSDSGDIIGKVTGVSYALGALTVFLSTFEGKVCLIAVPCLLLIAMEILSLVRSSRGKGDGEAERPEEQTRTTVDELK